MKFCSKCGTPCDESANVCSNCGEPFPVAETTFTLPSDDHTSEFDKADIDNNKVLALLPHAAGLLAVVAAAKIDISFSYFFDSLKAYIFSTNVNLTAFLVAIAAIIAAAFLAKDSGFVKFHNRNAVKILILDAAFAMVRVIPVVGTIVFLVGSLATMVIRAIAILQILGGKAKNLFVIDSLGIFGK